MNPDVVPVFEEMGGKRMSQRMAASGLLDARLADRVLDGALQYRLVKMVPPFDAGARIDRARRAYEAPVLAKWVTPAQT